MGKRSHKPKPKMWGWEPTSVEHVVRYVEYAQVSEIIGRIVRNPLYGGPKTSHPHGYPWQEIPEVAFKPNFFAALTEDVKKNGFRNPIVLHSMVEGLYLQFGASRFRVARKLQLPYVPALVVDWCDRYSEEPKVTPVNWTEFFTDIPWHFEFTPEGIDTNYGLERKMRDHYDPNGFAWCGESALFIDDEFSWLREKK